MEGWGSRALGRPGTSPRPPREKSISKRRGGKGKASIVAFKGVKNELRRRKIQHAWGDKKGGGGGRAPEKGVGGGGGMIVIRSICPMGGGSPCKPGSQSIEKKDRGEAGTAHLPNLGSRKDLQSRPADLGLGNR